MFSFPSELMLPPTNFTVTPGGSSVTMPKFVLKRRPVTDGPSKKPRTAPMDDDQSRDGENNLTESNQMMNGLASLCQNYDTDESD